MKKKIPINTLGDAYLSNGFSVGAENIRPHTKPESFKFSSSTLGLTVDVISNILFANNKEESRRRPTNQGGGNILDVFDNLNLSSSLSSDSDKEVSKSPQLSMLNGSMKPDKQAKQKPKENPEIRRRLGFFKINRPPSRHKTPPKALGLEVPEEPHTPPKTQKELEEFKDYSQTIKLQGISNLARETSNNDSDSASFSSIEEIKDVNAIKNYEPAEITISHNGKQISTPRAIPLLGTDSLGSKGQAPKSSNKRKVGMMAQTKVAPQSKMLDRPGTVAGDTETRKVAETKPSVFYPKLFSHSIRPGTTVAETGVRPGRDYAPQNLIKRPRREVKLAKHPLNPSIQARRLMTAGKLRSNTMLSHTKPYNIPFETGLDAEFLSLFAKD